jgi:hypothetical protein
VTVTVNVAVPSFSRVSVAVHVTVVVPTGNTLPDGGVHVTGTTPSTMSNAVATKGTTAPPGFSVSTAMLAGTVTIGGVVSRIVTRKSRVSCSVWYVAWQTTVVCAMGNVEPEGGTQTTVASLPCHLAVTLNVTTRPSGPVASRLRLFGIVQFQSGGSDAACGTAKPAMTRTSRRRRIIVSALP